jgi:M6 family metalloprotease-like protein
MKKKTLGIIMMLVTFNLFLTPNSYSSEVSSLQPCKIQRYDQTNPLSIGWPKFPGTLITIGKPKILVIGVDFPDAPAQDFTPESIPRLMNLESVSSYFKKVSNGLLDPQFKVVPNWVRMPHSSDHYGTNREGVLFVDGEWQTHHLEHDATNELKRSLNLSEFDAAILFVSGGAVLSGRSAYATVLDGGIRSLSDGLGNYVVVGYGIFRLAEVKPWKVIVHELNHLMGLEDLYLSTTDGWWQGKTPGPFGQQAYVYGTATDALGWNRWLNGWIPDSQVLCITNSRSYLDLLMTSSVSSDRERYQLIVIKQSDKKVLVIEQLSSQGFDSSTMPNSVLVYTIDTSIPQGEGPVRIIPRPTALTKAPFSPALPDWERFVEAPLIPKTYVDYGNWLISNQAAVNDGSRIAIYFGNDATNMKNYLDSLPKATKTISCKKDKKLKRVTGVNPVCPKGYKKVSGN